MRVSFGVGEGGFLAGVCRWLAFGKEDGLRGVGYGWLGGWLAGGE